VYSQTATERIAVLALSTSLWPLLKPRVELVQAGLDRIGSGEFVEIKIPLTPEE
jgi:hypothetical protein